MLSSRYRVGVFASGSGTNLQALIDACSGDAPARVVLVGSNASESGALTRARHHSIATLAIANSKDGPALLKALQELKVDLLVLAGYVKKLPDVVIAGMNGAVINIHPALLPGFGGQGMYGLRVHKAVLAHGSTISGATVHAVTTDYDRGPIVAQWPVPVHGTDTPETLAARVLQAEHKLLPAVVLAAARAGRVVRLAYRATAFGTAALVPLLSEQFLNSNH